jgi:hypothetical protein
MSLNSTGKLLALMTRPTVARIAFFVLLVWMSWPVVELFDSWDQPVDTGNDSQYSFIVLGLCVGLAYLIARSKRVHSLSEFANVFARLFRRLVLPSPPFVKRLDFTPDSPGPPLSPPCSCAVLRI